MKRIIAFALAAAAAFTSASCNKETVSELETVPVSLSVSLPDDVLTKAISDGKKANVVYWAAFDNTLATPTPINNLHGTAEIGSDMKAVIDVNLVMHFPYRFVFWAHCGDDKHENSAYVLGDEFYNSGKVKVNYSGDANDEERDAFYAYEEITIDQTQESRFRTIPLYRPFAQINFLAEDYDIVETAIGTGLKSTIQITGLPDVLDGFDGSVTTTDAGAVTDLNATAVLAERYTYNNKTYGWYSMNYVLANEEKKLSQVLGIFSHTKFAEDIKVTVQNVPYERNHRTNIMGSFLTEQADLTVEIKEGFLPTDFIKDDEITVE